MLESDTQTVEAVKKDQQVETDKSGGALSDEQLELLSRLLVTCQNSQQIAFTLQMLQANQVTAQKEGVDEKEESDSANTKNEKVAQK